jgi:hypothetical protein
MKRTPIPFRWQLVLLPAIVLALALPAGADAAMRSTKLSDNLCETTGGGRFVDIPGFPGETIDRRLLRDIRWMKRKFDIFITDGYSTAPYHARNGEHPIGLALDIVPAGDGSWRKIARLARKAEPRQDQPRLPWRWVGWNGDPNHGRGNHLHLSYAHSETRPKHPARTVYTRRCPDGTTMVKSASAAKAPATSGLAPVSPEKAGIGRNPADDPRLVDEPIEGYSYDRGERCRDGVPKGMRALRRWLERNVRGESWGINRCERWGGGRFSVHSEGRAIDWHLDASIRKERRAAMELIGLLLESDRNGNHAALARRMGVQGLIFNCKSWWSGPGGLGPYSACYRNGHRIKIDRTQAHKDHIHIELNRAGARKNTSFWQSPLAGE